MARDRSYFGSFLSFLFPLLWLFAFVVFDTYRVNVEEWEVGVAALLAIGLGGAVAMAAALGTLAYVRPSQGLRLQFLVYSLAGIGFLHQLFPVTSEPALIGEGPVLQFEFSALLQALSWTITLGVPLLLYRLRGRLLPPSVFASALLSVALLAATLWGALRSEPPKAWMKWHRAGILDTEELQELYTLSSGHNIVLYILDAVPADVALEVFEGFPKRDAFKDFDFYRNNSGIAPRTRMALPNFHVGRFWDQSWDEHRASWAEKVSQGSFMNQLADAGWSTAQVGSRGCPARIAVCGSRHEYNQGLVGRSDPLGGYRQALDISLLRLAPLALKPLVYHDGEFLLDRLTARWRSIDEGPHFDRSSLRDNALIRFLADHARVQPGPPHFKLFHLLSSHPPFDLSPDCKTKYTGPRRRPREGQLVHFACQLEELAGLVGRLREWEIYDRTTLILAADHGYHFPSRFLPDDYRSGEIRLFQVLLTQANPLLMVKFEGVDRAEMRIREEPTSTIDIAATVVDLAGLDAKVLFPQARPLTSPGLQEARERFYVQYTIPFRPTAPLSLFAINGPIWEESSWRLVTRFPGKGQGSGESARRALRASP